MNLIVSGLVEIELTDPEGLCRVPALIPPALQSIDFWSNSQGKVELVHESCRIDLPDVLVTGLPAGASILKVIPFLKVRAIKNTSDSTNSLSGAQAIRMWKPGLSGIFGVSIGPTMVAIDLQPGMWSMKSMPQPGVGAVLMGNDVKSVVDGNGTYKFKFEAARAKKATLVLLDVIVGLKIHFR